jgi:plasmid stabilization system protein ParE
VVHSVGFSPEAQAELLDLYDFISNEAGAARALDYIARIENDCLGFASMPERGTKRDDIRPGLRVAGFEPRVAIAFRLSDHSLTILRIFYGGRDLTGALSDR